MARTHRAHLSATDSAKKGGRTEEKRDRLLLKTHKQRRSNERVRVRKDYL